MDPQGNNVHNARRQGAPKREAKTPAVCLWPGSAGAWDGAAHGVELGFEISILGFRKDGAGG